jgi:hypothetical protein
MVKALMRQGEVGYDLFSVIAFGTGRIVSLVIIFKTRYGLHTYSEDKAIDSDLCRKGSHYDVHCHHAQFCSSYDWIHVVLCTNYEVLCRQLFRVWAVDRLW